MKKLHKNILLALTIPLFIQNPIVLSNEAEINITANQEVVSVENVQTNEFEGFRNDWSAGYGYIAVQNSGPIQSQIRLISSGDRIYLEVPTGAYTGSFQVVVRHGNQFSVTTLTVRGSLDERLLLEIGVGSENRISQVMIGSFTRDEEYCDETFYDDERDGMMPEFDEESDETFYDDERDGMMPEFDEESDETFYDDERDGMMPEFDEESDETFYNDERDDMTPEIDEEIEEDIAGEEEVEEDIDEEDEEEQSTKPSKPNLPQTGFNTAGTLLAGIGSIIFGTILSKSKKF